jgi:hypothetical protein
MVMDLFRISIDLVGSSIDLAAELVDLAGSSIDLADLADRDGDGSVPDLDRPGGANRVRWCNYITRREDRTRWPPTMP